MKPSSPSYLLWALGVLAIAASGTAGAVDPSQWKCETCPFEEAGTTGSVEGGVEGVSDASAKFGDYTGLQKQGGYAVLNGDVRYRSDNGYYGDASASDLGIDTRRIDAAGGKEGNYEVRLGYSEIPRHFSDNTVTPFIGAGGNNQTLPPGFPVTSTADIPGSAFHPFDIEYKRQRFELGGTLYTGDNWTHELTYRHDIRDGSQVTSGSFYSSAAQLIAPVDQTTDQLQLSTSYRAQKWEATFAYYGSIFHNSDASLTWANPFNPVVAGATSGQLALPPDNQFHQLLASGTYKILPTLRISADGAIGRMTQDEAYVPITTNASLAATLPGLPATSLNGQVNVYNASVRLAYNPIEALRVNGSYAHNERDNRTDSHAYPGVNADMFVDPALRSNQPFSFKQDIFKLNADYRGPSWLKSAVGVDWDNRGYTYQDIATSREGTFWGRFGAQVQEIMTVAVKFAHGQRDNQGYGSATWVTPPENPFMRKYDLANRRRDTGTLLAEFTPIEGWTLDAHLDMSNDTYTESTVGLTDGRSRAYGADLTGAIGENTQLRLFVEAERLRSSQAGSSAAFYPDWSAQNKDSVNVAGIGIKHTMLGGKLQLGGDFTYTRSESDVTVNAGAPDPAFPQANTTLQTFKLHASYQLQKNIWINGGYWYETYRSVDWAYDGVSPTAISNFLAVGQEAPNYTVNVVSVSVRYRF